MKRWLGILLVTAWGTVIAAQPEGKVSAARGKEVFQQWCAACHAPGIRHPGTLALEAKYKGAVPAALEERKDLAPQFITYFVRNGVSIMPFFRKTEVSDQDLEALTRYLTEGKTP
ncbi:c-type cytochrome [Pseudomonas sp. UL073]|uniref:C-type cytochrome n=1 Tax=Zestomonas insulae TaxID=2809017 RepID=A0ABS2IDJ2_9GAMM|nr:c-type cytochrome [Pseudomonas insulae]MBM7061037.1 c-type cytochrome [Pseudomonas insulae]